VVMSGTKSGKRGRRRGSAPPDGVEARRLTAALGIRERGMGGTAERREWRRSPPFPAAGVARRSSPFPQRRLTAARFPARSLPVSRVDRDALYRVEDDHGEGRPGLVALQIDRNQSLAYVGAAAIARASGIEGECNHIGAAVLAAADLRILPAQLIVQRDHRTLEEIFHPANGSAWPAVARVPVNVEPVVPVSSTVKY